MACSTPCQVDLGCAFACAGNAQLWLFTTSPNSSHCYSSGNPALSSDDNIELLWEGPALVGTSVPARQDRRDNGRIEGQVREVTFPANSLTISTNIWAFLQLRGDLIGGRVESVARDADSVTVITVDMSKPVPFAPALAGVPDWIRAPQV